MARIRIKLDYVLQIQGDHIPAVADIKDLIMHGAINSIQGIDALEGNAKLGMTNLSFCRRTGRAKPIPKAKLPPKPKLKLV